MICKKCHYRSEERLKYCPKCGNIMSLEERQAGLPEGDELLNKLYIVQNYLQRTSDKLDQFWDLERYYRKEQYIKRQKNVETKTIIGKSQYALFVSGMTFSVLFAIISLINGNVGNFIFSFVITAIFAIGKIKERKKLFRFGGFLLFLMCIMWVEGIISIFKNTILLSALLYLATNIFAFIIASYISIIIVRKYNESVDSYNDAADYAEEVYNDEVRKNNEIINQKRINLSIEIMELTDEMQAETAHWYPVDYYALDSVSKFIKIVRNYEADTIKEMLKIYKQDEYRSQILNNQVDLRNKMNASLMNQEKMIQLQKVSNLIQMGNLAVNLVTATNTMRMKKTLHSIDDNTARGATAAINAANASASAAESAERAAQAAQYVASKIR